MQRTLKRDFWIRAAFWSLLAFHAMRLFTIIPLSSFKNPFPLSEGAHMYEAVESWEVGKELRSSSSIQRPVWRSHHRFPVFFGAAFSSFIHPALFFKLFNFLLFLLLPLFLFFSAKNFGGDRETSLLAMALSIAGFSTFHPFSWHLIHMGHVMVLLSAHLSIFCLSLFSRLLKKTTFSSMVAFSVAYLVLGNVHWQVSVLLIIPFVIQFIFNRKSIRQNIRWRLVVLLTTVLICNAHFFWMTPDLDAKTQFSDFYIIYWPFSGWHSLPESLVRVFMVLFAYEGIRTLVKKRNKDWLMFMVWSIILFIVSFAGSHIAIVESWGPRQFLYLFSISLIFPASYFIRTVLIKNNRLIRVIVFAVIWFQVTSPIKDAHAEQKIQIYDPAPYHDLVQALDRHGSSGTIYFEPDETYGFVAGYMKIFTSRPIVEKSLQPLDQDTLVEMLEKRNISHIVSYSLKSRHYWDQFRSFVEPLDIKSPPDIPNIDQIRIELEKQGHPGGFVPQPKVGLYRLYRVGHL